MTNFINVVTNPPITLTGADGSIQHVTSVTTTYQPLLVYPILGLAAIFLFLTVKWLLQQRADGEN